jgi:hypothetical protein
MYFIQGNNTTNIILMLCIVFILILCSWSVLYPDCPIHILIWFYACLISFALWFLTPISILFQLYREERFYCWRKLEYRQYNVQKKRTKVQIIIFKILYRKLLIEQNEPNKELGDNLVLFVLHPIMNNTPRVLYLEQ